VTKPSHGVLRRWCPWIATSIIIVTVLLGFVMIRQVSEDYVGSSEASTYTEAESDAYKAEHTAAGILTTEDDFFNNNIFKSPKA